MFVVQVCHRNFNKSNGKYKLKFRKFKNVCSTKKSFDQNYNRKGKSSTTRAVARNGRSRRGNRDNPNLTTAISSRKKNVAATNQENLFKLNNLKMCERNNNSKNITSISKRGHQHHPKNIGNRKSNINVEDILSILSTTTTPPSPVPLHQHVQHESTTLPNNIDTATIISTRQGYTNQQNSDNQLLDSNANNVSPTSQRKKKKSSSTQFLQNANKVDHQQHQQQNRKEEIILNSDTLTANALNNNHVIISNQQLNENSLININKDNENSNNESALLLCDINASNELVNNDSINKVMNTSTTSDVSTISQSSSKSLTTPNSKTKKSSKNSEGSSSSSSNKKRRIKKTASSTDISKVERASGDGAPSDDKNQPNDEDGDPEQAEWAKLRCTSERTEVIAERENRRQKRCADYPGLAFGRSIFSSDTMMKFNIIRNELHNIMKTQLKRVGKIQEVFGILWGNVRLN